MEQYVITEEEEEEEEEEVRSILKKPSEQGAANFGRNYVQKLLSRRLVRIIYNVGTDELVVVSVMLRRRR